MPRIWLPVTYGGRTTHILIPNTQNIDDGQLDEIIAWEQEKTLAELKKLPAKKPMTVARRQEIVGELKEYGEFLRRKAG